MDWIEWRRDRGWVFMAGIGHGLAWVLGVLVGAEGRGSRCAWWWLYVGGLGVGAVGKECGVGSEGGRRFGRCFSSL